MTKGQNFYVERMESKKPSSFSRYTVSLSSGKTQYLVIFLQYIINNQIRSEKFKFLLAENKNQSVKIMKNLKNCETP